MDSTITFWGTRGSIPSPGAGTVRYGGNTPCTTVEDEAGHLVILDAGSGIRELGIALGEAERSPLRADILISHTHWDHIQGLPFFRPLAVRGNRVRIYGARQLDVSLREVLDRQMDPMVFPVPLKALPADLSVREIGEETFRTDGYDVATMRLRHPGCTLAYRLTPHGGGRTLAYVTDNELGPGGQYDVTEDWRARFVQFLSGVHTLIHDAMYTEDLGADRAGWGHSTATEAVQVAAESGVERLILFHHEPTHDDGALDALLEQAQALARRMDAGLQVDAAREGMRVRL